MKQEKKPFKKMLEDINWTNTKTISIQLTVFATVLTFYVAGVSSNAVVILGWLMLIATGYLVFKENETFSNFFFFYNV